MNKKAEYARKRIASYASLGYAVDQVIHWLIVLAKFEPEGVAYCECHGIELYATPDRTAREIRAFYDRQQMQILGKNHTHTIRFC